MEGRDWPNRDSSRFVEADTYRWHVQEMVPDAENAPVCLLIHGTGAATHSWRDVMPILAKTYRVIAIDLPGHGFTKPSHARRVSLPQMTASVGVLLEELGAKPDVIIGHSAGAAIGVQLLLDNGWNTALVGLNPALLPFPGLAAKLFPTLAKILFTNPFVSRIFARMMRSPSEVDRFMRKSTGSTIDRAGVDLYHRLLTRSGHCDGAIRMMASWELEELQRRLPRLSSHTVLVHGSLDNAIPKSAIKQACALIPGCVFEEVKNVGHLAHEEQPEQIADLIAAFVAGSSE
ncbi:alpha/beta fold hydrolase [Altererythrobacter aestiaquae]|uniref:Alpha/beta fold hydrolase n=2 Tax=Pontixanthobacter aestiaquae TaxID=1509367 RepID=A0A844ZAL3_9SPHN|nr:alpha/beta fold hydrolase [Pontixanthobacter aestiaquae]